MPKGNGWKKNNANLQKILFEKYKNDKKFLKDFLKKRA